MKETLKYKKLTLALTNYDLFISQRNLNLNGSSFMSLGADEVDIEVNYHNSLMQLMRRYMKKIDSILFIKSLPDSYHKLIHNPVIGICTPVRLVFIKINSSGSADAGIL